MNWKEVLAHMSQREREINGPRTGWVRTIMLLFQKGTSIAVLVRVKTPLRSHLDREHVDAWSKRHWSEIAYGDWAIDLSEDGLASTQPGKGVRGWIPSPCP